MEQSTQKLQVRETIKKAWQTYKEAPFFYPALMLVAIIITLVLDLGGMLFAETVPSILYGIISFFASSLIAVSIIKLTLLHVRGTKPSLSNLFTFSSREYFLYAVVTILVGGLSALGFILLIVPGIIISIMLGCAGILTLDGEVTVKGALKKSKDITSGNKWKIFFFILSLILVNVLGLLALGVGIFVSSAVSYLAIMHAYEFLLANQKD